MLTWLWYWFWQGGSQPARPGFAPALHGCDPTARGMIGTDLGGQIHGPAITAIATIGADTGGKIHGPARETL